MNKKILLVATFLFTVVLATSAFTRVDRSIANQGNLTAYSAAEISAYRWIAMANFYKAQGVSTGYLASLNAADRAAYRWGALDRERLLRATSGAMSADLTAFNASDISVYRWEAMAKFYASQGWLTRNSGALNISATTQQVNGERLYSWPGH